MVGLSCGLRKSALWYVTILARSALYQNFASAARAGLTVQFGGVRARVGNIPQEVKNRVPIHFRAFNLSLYL